MYFTGKVSRHGNLEFVKRNGDRIYVDNRCNVITGEVTEFEYMFILVMFCISTSSY